MTFHIPFVVKRSPFTVCTIFKLRIKWIFSPIFRKNLDFLGNVTLLYLRKDVDSFVHSLPGHWYEDLWCVDDDSKEKVLYLIQIFLVPSYSTRVPRGNYTLPVRFPFFFPESKLPLSHCLSLKNLPDLWFVYSDPKTFLVSTIMNRSYSTVYINGDSQFVSVLIDERTERTEEWWWW